MRSFPWMTLLAVSSALLAPNAKSQAPVGSGSVIFNGTFVDPIQDSCSFTGATEGELEFNDTSNIINSITPAKIEATINPSSNSQLNDFVIGLSSPTIATNSENDSFKEIDDVIGKGIGASQGSEEAPEPELEQGQPTLQLTPDANNTFINVNVRFQKQGDLQPGDYRSVVSLACYVS